MLSAVSSAVRGRSSQLKFKTSSCQSKQGSLKDVRIGKYHKSASGRSDGSSGKDKVDYGNLFKFDAKKSVSASKSEPKHEVDSFDDFFESLMKGSNQTQQTGSGTAAPASKNLDSILASLNKNPAGKNAASQAGKTVTAEESMKDLNNKLKKGASSRKETTKFEPSEPFLTEEEYAQNDVLDDLLAKEHDPEFVEFLSTLKAQKDTGSKSVFANPPEDEAQDERHVLTHRGIEGLFKSLGMDADPAIMKKAAEKLAQETKGLSGTEIQARLNALSAYARNEKNIEHASREEKLELDDALDQLRESLAKNTGEFPAFVTRVRTPLADGTVEEIDLLEQYTNRALRDLKLRGTQALPEAAVEESEDLFNELSEQHKTLDDFQYWALFPKQIKHWLVYTKTPKGFYNDFGEWETHVPKPRQGYEEFEAPMDATPEQTELAAEEEEEFDVLDDDELLAELKQQPGVQKMLEDDVEQGVSDDLPDDEQVLGDELKLMMNSLTAKDPRAAHAILGSMAVQATEEASAALAEAKAELEKGNGGTEEDWAYWESVYQNEQTYLPTDLKGQYRYRIKPEEIADLHPRLRRLFSFRNANDAEIAAFRAQNYIKKWGKHVADTGSSAVQIAILSQRIATLQAMMKANSNDTHNGYRLKQLLARRKGLMKHLKKRDLRTYYGVLKDVGIRDNVQLWTAAKK